MRRFAGILLLSTSCRSAYKTSLQDAKQAPDHDRFQEWIDEEKLEKQYAQLVELLEKENLHDVVPTWQLLRQGTDWDHVDHAPFAMPPEEQWEGMIPTLSFMERVLIPRIGPVEVVSGYRTEAFNRAAGGSSGSRHMTFEAIDLVPLERQTRDHLHRDLRSIYESHGDEHALGLGLYQNTRFHVDTWKNRHW